MRTVLVVPDEALRQELLIALADFAEIQVVRQVCSYPEADDCLRIVRARRPDFIFISAEDFSSFQALATTLDDRMPGLPVICVAREADPAQLTPRLMHLGVRELLTAPVTSEKLGAVIAAIARQLARHPAPVIRLGDLYAFLPAKPGVGSSTITVSTSCALAMNCTSERYCSIAT